MNKRTAMDALAELNIKRQKVALSKMTLGTNSDSALTAYSKRKAQIDRWKQSDTEREPTEIVNRPKRVKFADKCIFQAACASNDKVQVGRMLRDGYDINAVDDDGITALHQACIEDNFEMVEFLLSHGADVNISDNEGWTPLHAVATCCYVSIAKLLLEHDADVIALNNDCNIPLDICKNDDIRDLFKHVIATKGIDLGEARRGEEVKMLNDAKKWFTNGYYHEDPHPITGATAMHVASCKGYIKVLDQLIKAGADINATDFDGWTPLHAAAHWGQEEACRVLVEASCDYNLRNNNDQLAIDVASLNLIPILEDYKKRSEASDLKTTGRRYPKRKSLRPIMKDGIILRGILKKRDYSSSNSGSDVAEELMESEAEDTVGDLRSSAEPMDLPCHSINNNNSLSSTLLTCHHHHPSSLSSEPFLCMHEPKPGKFFDNDDTYSQDQLSNSLATPPFSFKSSDELFVAVSSASTSTIGDSVRVTTPSLVPSLTSSSSTLSPIPSTSSGSSCVAVPKSDFLTTEPGVGGGDTDENSAAWKRGGSLRTRTPISGSSVPEDEGSRPERSALGRTRSETASDINLRRAFSFESDTKFYSRLVSARNRIKAIEATSAAISNLLDMSTKASTSTTTTTTSTKVNSSSPQPSTSSTAILCSSTAHSSTNVDTVIPLLPLTTPTTSGTDEKTGLNHQDNPSKMPNKTYHVASDHNPEVILRRKEPVESTTSPPLTGPSPSGNLQKTPGPSNSGVQTRSGEVHGGGDSSGATSPASSSNMGAKTGPVSKFKQFLIKSFVPPARDEESETQRKANAKRVRETRRSTQGVTLEELKSAEQYIKAQQINAQTALEQKTDTGTTTTTVPGVPSSSTTPGALRKDEDSLERRPSWRLRVDDSDRSKFSLEDMRTVGSSRVVTEPGIKLGNLGESDQIEMPPPRSPLVRHRRNELLHSRPPRPTEEHVDKNPEDGSDDLKGAGAQGIIAKKKRPKRRSTGIVYVANEVSEGLVQSDTETSGKGSDAETGQDSSKNENGVVTRVNYRKLYEETLKENQQLKSRISGLEDQLTDLHLKLERAALPSRIGSDIMDKKEKRALEQKFREMEEELKNARSMAADNQKLRDENGALIRVISKLSK